MTVAPDLLEALKMFAGHAEGVVISQPERGKFERRPMTRAELAARVPAIKIAKDIYRLADQAGVCYYEIWRLIVEAMDALTAALANGAPTGREPEPERTVAWKSSEESPVAFGAAASVPDCVVDYKSLVDWLVMTCKRFGTSPSTPYKIAAVLIDAGKSGERPTQTQHSKRWADAPKSPSGAGAACSHCGEDVSYDYAVQEVIDEFNGDIGDIAAELIEMRKRAAPASGSELKRAAKDDDADKVLQDALVAAANGQKPEGKTITYRGSGGDLAKDVLALLDQVELKRFMECMPALYVAPSSSAAEMREQIANKLDEMSSSAYCRALEMSRKELSLGKEAMLKSGQFTLENLRALEAMHREFGRSAGLHDAARAIRQLPEKEG